MVCGVGSCSQDGHEGPEVLPALSQHDGSLQKESVSFHEDRGQVRINQRYLPQVQKGGVRVQVLRICWPFPHLVLPHTFTQELGCRNRARCSVRQHPLLAHPSKTRSSKTGCASSSS